MDDIGWLRPFDIEYLHEMADSRPHTRQEWESRMPTTVPWPGPEGLRENRVLYQRAHDEKRDRGELCARCDGEVGYG